MTITIPIWAIWTLGGLAAIIILCLAVIGAVFLWAFKDGFSMWN